MKYIRSLARAVSGLIGRLTLPAIDFNSSLDVRLLGGSEHTFVGYYDHDPVSCDGQSILCHQVSRSFSKSVEPLSGEIGLININDGRFFPVTTTSALNWQLGSRAQWLTDQTIIYNDLEKNKQVSYIRNVKSGDIVSHLEWPFWAISPDKQLCVSLNFARLSKTRPGYGYRGNNEDRLTEVIRVFRAEDQSVVYERKLSDILEEINLIAYPGNDFYLNHVAWSPCSTKFISVLSFDDRRTSVRCVYPLLFRVAHRQVQRIHDSGYFSHHVWVDDRRLFAYLKVKGNTGFAIWSENEGWKPVIKSLPSLDGHPSLMPFARKVIIDSYPDRLGRMRLYLGDYESNQPMKLLGTIMNEAAFRGALRCDLHPRYSQNNKMVVCDFPSKGVRRVLVLQGLDD